jgi:hypothetical protein
MIRARHRFSGAAIVLRLLLASSAGHAQSPVRRMRGSQLAANTWRAADCMPRHSADRSKPYSGGLPVHTPSGTIFSVNIASDMHTGIGQWTFADFKNALHYDLRADGAHLCSLPETRRRPLRPRRAHEAVPEPDVVRALPVGHALVYREPRPFAGKLVRPSEKEKLVPQDQVKAAGALLDHPSLPVSGDTASDLAVKFASSNPKAAPANVANALTTAYCTAVISTPSVEQALQRAWVQDFGSQVIQTLQRGTPASQKN